VGPEEPWEQLKPACVLLSGKRYDQSDGPSARGRFVRMSVNGHPSLVNASSIVGLYAEQLPLAVERVEAKERKRAEEAATVKRAAELVEQLVAAGFSSCKPDGKVGVVVSYAELEQLFGGWQDGHC